jgi:WD40 repeat protein
MVYRGGKVINNFEYEDSRPITALAYSPNGLYAVYSEEGVGEITLLNLVAGEEENIFFGHQETVTSLAFHPNGHEFFSASWDKTIIEWDFISYQRVRTYYGHEGGINTVSVSSDGEFVASGGYDAGLRLWQTHNPILLAQTHADNGDLVSTAYTPTGMLALGASDGTISLYKQSDPQTVTLTRQFQGYGSQVRDMIFTAEGDSLISLYWDSHLTRRDVTTGKRLWSLIIPQEAPLNLTLLPDNKTLLVVFAGGWGIYDWQTGTEQSWIPFKEKPIRVIAAHPNGEWVAVGVNDLTRNLFLVDWRTGSIVRTYSGHRDGVTSIVFDRDGSHLLTGSFDTDVRIWETDTGRVMNVFSGHNDRVVSVQFVPGTEFVISGSNDRSLRLWNVHTGFLVYRYQSHTDRVVDVFINQNGRGLISSGMDGRVFFWALPPKIPDMVDWARHNRYVRPLTCAEGNLYLNLDQDCTTDTTEATDTAP